MNLELHLLGGLEAIRSEQPVSLGGPKQRALLVALALDRGRVVSVDTLIESLWPRDPAETAAHAVQVYVSQLRKALGPEAIATRAPGYLLDLDPDALDVERFLRLTDEGRAALDAGDPTTAAGLLRDALALWRGPALADFRYDSFAQAEIARLEDLRSVAQESRIEADLALGLDSRLVSELESMVEAHPLRERPRALLMLALYRAGRQADALAAYRRTRATFVEELGIEPGPELRELEAAILRQDKTLLPDSRAVRPMQFRRLVSIVCATFDSAKLATLDAEASAVVLDRYLQVAAVATARHGGSFERPADDTVLAVFGSPVSREDDALRAARAALDLVSDVVELDEALAFEYRVAAPLRVGIETGEVVVAPDDVRRRLPHGEAVGTAQRLAHAAAEGEIVVGEVTGRLIDHAAALIPLSDPAFSPRAYRLAGLAPAAPAFARRDDAPYVGREDALAKLDDLLAHVGADGAARAVLIVGEPGVGKSRLVAQFARRSTAMTLWGRCLPYGDGITYGPLREALGQARASEERDSIVAALDAATPAVAAELALAVRRFFVGLARARPLVLVFDDLHWAESTFLELIEHLAVNTEGAILIVCIGREELLDERPAFLEEADRMVVDALSPMETRTILDRLGGGSLATDQSDRIVEAAEGNPLFLEQLLALALEGGAEERLPATVQTLLAARLDRLGPGERAVLERGAVIGREFSVEDVTPLLPPEAHAVGAHLDNLSRRGFVRAADGGFVFRHGMVQEAVYRATPKRLRASLHARHAESLDRMSVPPTDLDETVGYHLEQSYRLRAELREVDEATTELGELGGRRLGAAGVRALRRGDVPAASHLLERAISLLPAQHPLRRELLCELGLVRIAAHDADAALDALAGAIALATDAGDRRIDARARIELAYIRLRAEAGTTADELLEETVKGIPLFERAGDRRALGRAWLLTGFVQGGHRGDHTAWLAAAERALEHYKAARWPTSTCVGEIAAALYWGPTPVEDAVGKCELLLCDESLDLPGTAYVQTFLAGLLAQRQQFRDARQLAAASQATLDELGLRAAVQTYCAPVSAEIELLAGDPSRAERVLRSLCEQLEYAKDFSHLASRAGDLAEALADQHLIEQADEWTRVAEEHAASDDLNAQLLWRPIRARVSAHRGELDDAERLALEGVALADSTDDLNRRARARRELAEVLRLAGKQREASAASQHAIELYEQKGNLAGAARVRSSQVGIEVE
jgi:DNA-binding SARP family transcriptional activator